MRERTLTSQSGSEVVAFATATFASEGSAVIADVENSSTRTQATSTGPAILPMEGSRPRGK